VEDPERLLESSATARFTVRGRIRRLPGTIWVVGEDFAAIGVDEDLRSYVVGAMVLMIAKGFDAREIFEEMAYGVEEWLIDDEVSENRVK